MNIEELRNHCLSIKGAEESMPFDDDTPVYKVMGKMFAYYALTPKDGKIAVNLKCNPERTIELRERYTGIRRAIHAGESLLWNAVYIESDVPDSLIEELVAHSKDEVIRNLPKKKQAEYNSTLILEDIRQTFISNIDEKTLTSVKHFFKEGETAKTYGIKMAEVSKIAKVAFQQIKDYPKQTIFELCEELWKSGYLEEAVVACQWSELLHKKYEPDDFAVFEHWLSNYVTNWADCDTLCNHTIGTFTIMYPEYLSKLKKWAKSPNRWVRRGAAVSLIIPARKGLFLNDILEIADILLLDKEDLVQKGYGWMLKAASMSETFVKGSDIIKMEHLNTVFNYVIKNKLIMPRTALRYAIEKMPANLKAEAMKK